MHIIVHTMTRSRIFYFTIILVHNRKKKVIPYLFKNKNFYKKIHKNVNTSHSYVLYIIKVQHNVTPYVKQNQFWLVIRLSIFIDLIYKTLNILTFMLYT